jgi:hypothetical protein
MSDLIIATILDKYVALLNDAVDDIKAELPDGMAIERPNRSGYDVVVYPCLDSLFRVILMMARDVKTLRGEHESNLAES